MANVDDLFDKYADIEVNKALSKQHSKDLETRQPSLFRHTLEDPNKEGMKKRVIEKMNAEEAAEKAKTKRAENEEFKDKRQPKSDLIRQAELDKMKEILNKPKGGGGGGAMPKSNRDITKNYKAGGKVSSASKRADGCAVRGKTKGRMI